MLKKYIIIFALINLVSYASLEAMQLEKQYSDESGKVIYRHNLSPENDPELANRKNSSPSIFETMKQDNARNQNSPVQFTPDIEQELAQRLESIIIERPQRASTPLTFEEYLSFSLTPHARKPSCYLLLQHMVSISKLDENKIKSGSLANIRVYAVCPDGMLDRIDTKAQALYAIDGKLYKGYEPEAEIIDYFTTNTGDLMLCTKKQHFIKLETITSFKACNNSTILYTQNGAYSIEE